VPLAEETGVIVELGRWVLRQATKDAAAWPAGPDGVAPAVAVNVAVRQVRDADLYSDVVTALADSGLPADRLHLEITESALMDTSDDGKPDLATLSELAHLGIGIAIDDFGTGYSNLTLLRRLPARCLKIDSSLVADLPCRTEDTAAESIVVALITVAHACGLTVTAEGVETLAQAHRLAELGADAAQGFHFSRPVPTEMVPVLLGVV
jgi:EAL domain-containing protein (putative c-di-GMP-specific phosphodiesterase class I)